ncbi:glycosyltransferase [Cellulomonas iranensis]|uniref:glycosyltransferase n=1 Tax=Cellulomonas iranensis TaxID=76862 RepID=UPI000B3C2885|nr:glycosyltransferase family 2 protein [Cellulomonas iranensis]UCN15904.1 glycosyltransferase family 2 protein [Cellulomonas iranensis]
MTDPRRHDGTTATAGAADVLMLAFGAEPYLHEAVAAVLASEGVDVRLTLVDNGCTTDAVATLPPDPRVRLVVPGSNLGFTGGMNAAAAGTSGRPLVLVNSDAVVAPDAVATLVAALADDPRLGVAGGLVRLASDPDRVNSTGNPLHVLGLCWAGGLDEPVAAHATGREVASASGALVAVDRALWDELGGFPEEYFAYLEDLELSWRAWQHGRTVRYVPAASAVHHFEFGRSPLKMYLLERNRLLFVLTTYEARTLALLAVPLLAFDVAMLAVATAQGWGRQKLRGWGWVLRHPGVVARRRRTVQRSRTVPDRDLAHLMTDTFDSAQFPLPAAAAPLQGVLRLWWRLVRRVL